MVLIDLNDLRRVSEGEDTDCVRVSKRWLKQSIIELEQGRAAQAERCAVQPTDLDLTGDAK